MTVVGEDLVELRTYSRVAKVVRAELLSSVLRPNLQVWCSVKLVRALELCVYLMMVVVLEAKLLGVVLRP